MRVWISPGGLSATIILQSRDSTTLGLSGFERQSDPEESLHLIEHGRERGLQFECLLDLVGANKRILAVFEETRALMLADECDEGGRIGLPIRWESLEIFENRRNACGGEQCDSVLGVFVEVGVENALIHKMGFPVDGKQQPAQVVQF